MTMFEIFRYAQNDKRLFVILSLWRSIHKFNMQIAPLKCGFFSIAQNDNDLRFLFLSESLK